MQLNKNVPIVVLQFQFAKRSSVPAWIPTVPPPETKNEREKRLNRQGSGQLVMGPQENSAIDGLLDGLYENGYDIVDVKHEERLDDRNPRKTFQIVQATFYRRDESDNGELVLAPVNPQAEELLDKACGGLVELCANNFWRVRVYDNPFFRRGEPVEGLHTATICCDVKKPTVQGNGQPVLVWQKERIEIEGPPSVEEWRAGYPNLYERVGNAPQPLVPGHRLTLDGDTFLLV